MEPSEKSACDHKNWEVLGSHTVGYGKCFDCDKEIGLDVLFDGLRRRMEAALELVKVASLDVPSSATLIIEAQIGTISRQDQERLLYNLHKDGFKQIVFIESMPGRSKLKFTALKNVEPQEMIGTTHKE